ncbi:DUF3768 domain-containing protein [Sphingomonas sp. S1-29]|uniref:DUF3768 domain-containing protein n=1 Tax=Sphingomonas sp. S1-29 TaxID=2991074 RepID=UPI00223F9673|nr:DUF3768 domain-containing protein [Sphingomonas sp. S1-29]UZK70461.1 DUF3768 domain-containing protein [Sphingomonas sp. S1-29]
MTGREEESCASKTHNTVDPHKVQRLNDAFRRNPQTGIITTTPGVRALGSAVIASILRQIVEFDDFTPDNDPYGEHDMGVLREGGAKVFWKIDYYNMALDAASPDPSDAAQTARVMTIMLAEEY